MTEIEVYKNLLKDSEKLSQDEIRGLKTSLSIAINNMKESILIKKINKAPNYLAVHNTIDNEVKVMMWRGEIVPCDSVSEEEQVERGFEDYNN